MIFSQVQRVRVLYKTILKLHRGLPMELQVIGTNYVKDEFRKHKHCNEIEAGIFMNEWTSYAISLADQLGLRGPKTAKEKFGASLTPEYVKKLKDEQIAQLYELMMEATKMSIDER